MPRKDKDENRGAEFATMDPDRRKRFEQTHPVNPGDSRGEELDFPEDDPRDPDHMGRHNQPESQELAEEKDVEAQEAGPLEEKENGSQAGKVW